MKIARQGRIEPRERSQRIRRRLGFDRLEVRSVPAIGLNFALGVGAVGANPSDIRAYAVAADSAGDVYVTGSLQGTADFDPGPGVTNLTGVGGRDIVLAKYSPAGSLLWAETLPGASASCTGQGSGIAVDPAGNVDLTGYYSGTVDFDPGPGVSSLTSPVYGGDAFVAQFSPSGGLNWARDIAGSQGTVDRGSAIGVDGSGNVYATGTFQQSATFGSVALSAGSVSQAFITKLNPSGTFLWAKATSGQSSSVASATSIAVSAAGDVAATGSFSGTVNFDPGASSTTLICHGSSDIFLWKLNSSGNFAWAKGVGGPGNDQGNGIAFDGSGNLYTTGAFTGTVNFNLGAEGPSLTAAGTNDVYILKLDGSGNRVWAESLTGSAGPSAGRGIAVSPTGDVLVAGDFSGTVDFDPGPSTHAIVSAGSTDVFLLQLTSAGTFKDVQTDGGSDLEGSSGLAAFGPDGVAIAGSYLSPAKFGPLTLGATGKVNFFLASLTTNYVPAPGAPTLQAASDTGISQTDGLTRATSPAFDLNSAEAGDAVDLLRDGRIVNSRIGPGAISDPGPVGEGVHLYTARQTNAAGKVSALGAATTVTIDTTPPPPPPPPQLSRSVKYQFNLPGSGSTSAGIFDDQGNLIRQLWTSKVLAAGEQLADWDGLDGFGNPATGRTNFEVTLNGSVYAAPGAVGNTGYGTDVTMIQLTHESQGLIDIASSFSGGIVEARSYDEGGTNIKQVYGLGEPAGLAYDPDLPYAIASDSMYLYVIGQRILANGDRAALLKRYALVGPGRPTFMAPAPFAGPTGPVAGVSVYSSELSLIPANASVEDRPLFDLPIRSLAVSSDTIFAVDLLAGEVRSWDKSTGVEKGSFPVALPLSVAVDASGQIWVAHGRHVISVYDKSGNWVADKVTDPAANFLSVATAGDGTVVAGDNNGSVKFYDPVSGALLKTFGAKAAVGDADPSHFASLQRAIMDSDGNLVTLDNANGGKRLIKWTGTAAPKKYESLAMEFMANGAFNPNDPAEYWSSSLKRYQLDPAMTASSYIGDGHPEGTVGVPAWPGAPPKILRLNNMDFLFVPGGDGVSAFRIDGKSALHLSAFVGDRITNAAGATSSLLGQFSWHDAAGSGLLKMADVQYNPLDTQTTYGLSYGENIDTHGNIIMSMNHKTVDEIPLASFDARNNPVYDMTKIKVLMQADTSSFGFTPYQAARGNDGSIYVLGRCKAWPDPLENGVDVYWFAGSALAKFDSSGSRLWAVRLPNMGVAIDVVPPRAGEDPTADHGVIIGGNVITGWHGSTPTIMQYSQSGLLLQQFSAGAGHAQSASAIDFPGGLGVQRDPRDNKIVISTEDDLWGRILIYTIDDSDIRTFGAESSLADDSGAPGDGLTDVRRPRLSGTAESGSLVEVLDAAGAVLGSTIAGADGGYTVAFAADLADGPHPSRVRATDAAGNVGAASLPLNLTIDTAAPAAPAAPSLLAADDSGAPGDGLTDVRRPRLSGTAESGSLVEVLDAAGAVLGSTIAGADGGYTVAFAADLADGPHPSRVRATDAAGNVGAASLPLNLTIDTAAPAAPAAPSLLAADDSGAPGDGLTDVRRPRLSGTAESGSLVEVLDAAGAVLGSTIAGADGGYTVAFAADLADGPHPSRVRATDAAGNVGAASLPLNLTIDTAAPAAPAAPSLLAADDSGALGDGVTNVKAPRLIGAAEANATIQIVDDFGKVLGSAGVGGDGAYSVSFTSPLPDGAVSAHVRAMDAAGNLSIASPALSLTIESTPPAAPNGLGLAGADDSGILGDGLTSVRRPHLIGRAAANSTVRLLDASGLVLGTGTAGSDGGFSVQVSGPLGDGPIAIRAQAADIAGNLGAPGAAFALTIDTTPPAAPAAPTLMPADDSGARGDNLTNVGRPRLLGRSEPGAAVLLLDAKGLALGHAVAGADGAFTVAPDAVLPEGLDALAVRAVDAAGNVGAASLPLNLTIDTAAPAAPAAPSLLAADDSGALGDGVTNVNRPHLVGATAAGATVQILDETGTILGSSTAAADGTYSVALVSALADGPHSLRTVAIDAAGNVSLAGPSLSLGIIATPPAAPGAPTIMPADDTGIVGDGATTVRRPRLLGSAPAGTVVDLLAQDGRTLGTTTAGADGTYLVQLPDGQGLGVKPLRARSRDIAGNVSVPSPSSSLNIITVVGDYEGGGRTDIAGYRPSTSEWLVAYSGGGAKAFPFGAAYGDIPVPGDYDGDGKADYGVFRPSNATWYILLSGGGSIVRAFGAPNLDIPIPADYLGDGKTDIATYRPTTSTFSILPSAHPDAAYAVAFGAPNLDMPIPADYDGDGKADIATYRPTTSTFSIIPSARPGSAYAVTFGAGNLDMPIPADYDGDGKADIATYRPTTSTFSIIPSARPGSAYAVTFGAGNLDVPVIGDFDGDGKADIATYRPTTAVWSILQSTAGAKSIAFGWAGVDAPLTASRAYQYRGSLAAPAAQILGAEAISPVSSAAVLAAAPPDSAAKAATARLAAAPPTRPRRLQPPVGRRPGPEPAPAGQGFGPALEKMVRLHLEPANHTSRRVMAAAHAARACL